MRHARQVATWIASLGVATAGCGRELLGADEEPLSPNAELRAPIETPEAPKPPKDVDDSGRLLAAEGLVSGFEVPKGLKLLRRERGYLEFEVNATADALREFWTGLDGRTGRRYTERRYLVENATVGFDVNHTRDTLDRLRLGDEYKDGYIYVAPGGGRSQRIRVHPPLTVVDPDDDPFIPKLEPAGPGNAPTPRGAPPPSRPQGIPARDDTSARPAGTGNGLAGGGGAGNDQGGGGASNDHGGGGTPNEPGTPSGTGTEPAPSGPNPQGPGLLPMAPSPLPPSLTPTGLAPNGNTPSKKYGPYPGGGRSVVPDIRQWQVQNPGTQFLD
ncbi:MAG: hypothetical protein IV100_25555 [Myxococcales bacterium]|nr:hypothetical protein [Myxococcales bacterium]